MVDLEIVAGQDLGLDHAETLVPLQVMLPRFWVASTKPERTL